MTRTTALKITGLLALMTVAALLGMREARQQAGLPPSTSNPPVPGMLWPRPMPIPPFTVVDHHNQEFGKERLRGRWSFLFFGYTHCPDICPITMAVLARAKQTIDRRLREAGAPDRAQGLFVSVDPARDDSETLARYATYFHPDFLGLGGSPEQIRQFTGRLGIPYYLHESDAAGHYLVDHSGSLFLSDPAGRLVAILPAPHKEEEIVDKFMRVRRFISSQAEAGGASMYSGHAGHAGRGDRG